MAVIELPRRKAMAGALLFVGLCFVAAGLLIVNARDKPFAAKAFFFARGGLLVIPCVRRLVSSSPRFRATPDGVWFGGGRVIPWRDVKAVFESNTQVKRMTATSVAFEFQRRTIVLKTPIGCWIEMPFAVGDIDVSSGDYEQPRVLASRLEAMRVTGTAG